MPEALEAAKRVLAANEAVRFGIFGVVGSSGVFPPRVFVNQFLARGSDPCDQDGRMGRWVPFAVPPDAYQPLLAWWTAGHPGAVEDGMGAACWDDWVQELLER